jgi:hydroxymethylbilane synthase
MKIRLGTRGSRLALIQSELFAQRLRDAGHTVELVSIVTEGDVRPITSLAPQGARSTRGARERGVSQFNRMSPGDGVFVAAIERALIAGEIEVAVHSAKDVPLEEHPELVTAAYPERADPRDVLVTRGGGASLDTLPRGATIGTDSPRRAGFARAARPDLRVVPLHGNVETRLRRLDAGEVDALVLAAAGLDRLGRSERIDQRLDPRLITPAPAQGALAVQARRRDHELLSLLAPYDIRFVRLAVETEREVLRATGGTCRAPVGALASIDGASFTMLVAGVNSDGTGKRIEQVSGPCQDALELAAGAGRRLVAEVALR